MASENLSGSVGLGGRNFHHDVVRVQRLLLQHGANPGRVDGRCGPLTVRAILRAQSGFLAPPDGRIDPGGATWRRLTAAQKPAASRPAAPHPSASKPAAAPAKPATPPADTPDCERKALLTLVPRPSRIPSAGSWSTEEKLRKAPNTSSKRMIQIGKISKSSNIWAWPC